MQGHYQFLAGQDPEPPKPRKRGRPAGSKDVVQRVRRFTKRAPKSSRKSAQEDPLGLKTGSNSPNATNKAVTCKAEGGDHDASSLLAAQDDEDEISSSSSNGENSDGAEGQCSTTDRQIVQTRIASSSASAQGAERPPEDSIGGSALASIEVHDPQHEEDDRQDAPELVDSNWFALHEQLFRKSRKD